MVKLSTLIWSTAIAIFACFAIIYLKPKPKTIEKTQTENVADSTNVEASTAPVASEPPSPILTNEQITKEKPIPSQLPIVVIGTLVTSDPKTSMASLFIKTKKFSDAYIVGTKVSDLATIVKIERNLVFLRNKSTGRLEYLKLNEADLAQFSNEISQSKDVQNIGVNSYAMNKTSLARHLNDLTGTLMTATAAPYKDSNGVIVGFKLLDMLPMGIFEQLGLKGMILSKV